MHRANLSIITISVLLLGATVAISSTVSEDAFARNERYGGSHTTSQAAALNNDCLNPILDSNTIDNVVGVGNCGGTVSQQDESGQASAPITFQTANPTIELQRATTTSQPGLGAPTPLPTCEECFTNAIAGNFLTEQQLEDFLAALPGNPTLEELCNSMATGVTSEELNTFSGIFHEMNLDGAGFLIIECLADVLGVVQ